jgi:hypothetical protein
MRVKTKEKIGPQSEETTEVSPQAECGGTAARLFVQANQTFIVI